jgi:hypothetical protein
MESVRAILDKLFEGIDLSDSIELSNAGTAELGVSRRGFTYGETHLDSLLQILLAADLPSFRCKCISHHGSPFERCETCGLRPVGANVVDLGSGSGKVVVSIALLTAAKMLDGVAAVHGIEVLAPLHHAAATTLQELNERFRAADAAEAPLLSTPLPTCRLVLADLTRHDLADADVCYMCSTAFTAELIEQWCEHAVRTLRPGSVVISLSARLPHRAFALETTLPCEASWGPERAYVHRVLSTERVQADENVANALAGLVSTSAQDGRTSYSFTEFDLRDAGAKGFGAFALRGYRAGERIFSEAPLALLVVTDRNRVQRDDGVAMIERVVAALSERRRAAYFALSQEVWHGATPTALGVWLSNAYPLDEGDSGGGSKQAVFAQICRLNHACNPNVIISWNARLRQQTVHAARKIVQGEELTASFYGGDGLAGMARNERCEHLKAKFHFQCACDLCALTGGELTRSEKRQRRLREISDGMKPPPPYRRLVKLVSEAVGLLRDEGLPASWAKIYYLRLVGSAADAGDVEAAGEWARKAAACACEACGADSPSYLNILQ